MNDNIVPSQSHQIIIGKPIEIDISGGEKVFVYLLQEIMNMVFLKNGQQAVFGFINYVMRQNPTAI